jgi:neutral ceramidase
MNARLKKISFVIFISILTALLSFITVSKQKDNNENTLLAGASRINITPTTPIRMSGYGNRDESFKGVHDSLYVTATVFSNGSEKSVIITADLIGFTHDFCEATMSKIESEAGIKKEFILLSANHNHGGPVNKTYAKDVSPEIEKYVQSVQQKIITAVKQANNQLQPALIGMGVGICKMNINRRARFADGNVGLGRNPDGPCDHDVAVIRVDDMKKNPIAIHINWPCHGTASGQENYQITGDWPGLAARYIEKEFGKEIIVPVTAGASADINPIYGPNDNFREIETIGMMVGDEVIRVAKTIQTFPNGNIEAIKMTVMAEGKKPSKSRAPNQELESGEKVPINLSALKIGNILFAGVSGELMTEIGMRIKEESPFKNTVIITHCDGSSGYLCTDQAYPEGGYEAMVSRVMPGTEYLISDNLNNMIQSFK